MHLADCDAHNVTPVLRFANRNIARRKVRQDSRTRERRVGAGRDWRPHILADFGVEVEPFDVRTTKNQIVSERNFLSEQCDFPFTASRPEANCRFS